MALHLALNGFHVFMVDLEGHGFSGGTRIVQLSVEQFHHSVSVLMEQVPEDLPCFLYGHSMGGLTVNTYLGLNPKIADRLAGVIYSAPFFGFPAHLNFDFAKKTMMSLGANVLGEFVLCPPNPLHKVCSSKVYQRVMLNDRKSNPFFAMRLASSFVRNIDIVGNYAHEIRYPY
jgi:alpha-beta hydrolase superfamily lysophospholipase